MPERRTPGPLCQVQRPLDIDDGTLCRAAMPSPGPVRGEGGSVASWDARSKLLEAARRTTAHLPIEMRDQFAALFSPTNITVTAGVLGAWAASHAVGVGEAADIALLLVGAATIGWQAGRAARDVWDFVTIAAAAQSQADLERAAAHLASAVVAVGITAFVALILKAGGKVLGRARVAPPEGEPLAGQAGEGGPWWKARDFGDDWPGTAVPQGFTMEVGGRTFRVTVNATKHMAENVGRLPGSGELANPGVWSTSPGGRIAQVDYPLSSLAGALERAAQRLAGLPPQRHFFSEGNWELGIDTADNPWAVYHAVPRGK
jgi:hypothetical protein